MSAFVPIIFRIDGTYLICCEITHPGSKFCELEFIPREMLEWVMKEGKASGVDYVPHVLHGLH